MPELITANNITTEQSAALTAYLAQPYPSTNGDTALSSILTAALYEIPITRAQLQDGLVHAGDSVPYVDKRRACNPLNDTVTPLNQQPTILDEVRSAFACNGISDTCYNECLFGVRLHHNQEGDRRIQCSALRAAGKEVLKPAEKTEPKYQFAEFGREGRRVSLILDAMINGRKFGGVNFLPQPMSPLGISREIVFTSSNLRGRRIHLSGVGIVTIDAGHNVSIVKPDPHTTVADYIAATKPNTYTGMRTAIYERNGRKISTRNHSPLGGYSILEATTKWTNTKTARKILAGTSILCPEDIALMTNQDLDLACIAYAYPEISRHLSELFENGRTDLVYLAMEKMGEALRRLHDNNLVHGQPGTNWTLAMVEREPRIVLRDFETLYSIGSHSPEAQRDARLHDVQHTVNHTADMAIIFRNANTKRPYDLSEAVFAMAIGYTKTESKARIAKKAILNLTGKRHVSEAEIDEVFLNFIR